MGIGAWALGNAVCLNQILFIKSLVRGIEPRTFSWAGECLTTLCRPIRGYIIGHVHPILKAYIKPWHSGIQTTSTQQAAFTAAATRWQQIVFGDGAGTG